jgi:Flp pilus assembly protein TadD
MRRLTNHRSPDPDDPAREGFDRMALEGEAVAGQSDEIAWLRPFGATVPGPVLSSAPAADEPEEVRVLRQAGELAAAGRRLDAVLLLRRHLEDTPADARARGRLAGLLDDGGDPDAALEELTRALDRAGDPVPLLVHRGAILARTGRPADAERDLREAIRRQPREADAHCHLGLALLRRGKGAEATGALMEALRLAPDHPEAAYYLGEARESQGDLAGALAALQRAAELLPANPRAYKLMGRLLDRMGRTDDAREMHRKAREAAAR